MGNKYYTSQRSQQILISLLKQYGIKNIIASPGTTNLSFVASIQQDPWFNVYSSVDERSAAYMAVGMAASSGEPIVITCTGATASRNYLPGLTEAYYRKLPVIAITATQNENKIGHLVAQVIDRSKQPADVVVCSEHIPVCSTLEDEWNVTIRINRALLALNHRGGGPVHINMATNYSNDFSVKELPKALKINRYTYCDDFPDIPSGKVAIWVGNHRRFTPDLISLIDKFCEKYNAVVFCDHASNYYGEYRAFVGVTATQKQYHSPIFNTELLIHIGEVSPDYPTVGQLKSTKSVWRVSEDGELRDLFGKLTNVFEMSEKYFFERYFNSDVNSSKEDSYLSECLSEEKRFKNLVPELPFSNIWIAQQLSSRLPADSVANFGILNSIRSWNFWDIHKSIECSCNSGGFGIDGGMSSFIGSAIINPTKLHFLFIGDLAFFYDMNSLGNRHLPNNLRILLVNNGKGTEFRNYNHPGALFGEDADAYIAAGGHFGNKSRDLVKHYVQDLGLKYLSASNKEELTSIIDEFVVGSNIKMPLLLEVFTDSEKESEALKIMDFLADNPEVKLKKIVKKFLPDNIVPLVKKVLK